MRRAVGCSWIADAEALVAALRETASTLPSGDHLGSADLRRELRELARLTAGQRQEPRLRLPGAAEGRRASSRRARSAGRESTSPVVICSARPPSIGTRQSRVLYAPSSIVRRP
jgi:hypothetical protein